MSTRPQQVGELFHRSRAGKMLPGRAARAGAREQPRSRLRGSTNPQGNRGGLGASFLRKAEGRESLWVLAKLFRHLVGKKKMSVPSAALLSDMNLTWLLVKCSFQVAGAGTAFCCAQLQISALFHLYLFIYFGGEAEEFFEKDGTIKSG